jgi:hypothetical protein
MFPGAASAATVTVTGNGDTVTVDGQVTLREAIASINGGANFNADVVAVGAYGTSDTINFAIGSGVQTIAPAGFQLPTLTVPVVINGTTQPGFAGTPIIVLDGASAGAFSRGLTINGGNSTVRGLVIHRFFYGIELNTGGGNTVAGNYIGLNAAGTAAMPNIDSGILVESGSNNNVIGGATALDRNVISGHTGNGIQAQTSTGITILGNFIGTNVAGTAALGNGIGINANLPNATIGGTAATTPGGPCTGACNLISGNVVGIGLGGASSGAVILGNLIGTNSAGTGPLGNTSVGIVVPTSTNTIGGTTPAAANVIAFNGAAGVQIDGTSNAVLGNSMFSNTGANLGIDLNPPGPNPNDAGDADTGANELQNFPVISSVSILAGLVTIGGSLNSTANTTFRVEFFSNTACNAAAPNDFGEGQTFLGFANVTTDGAGNGSFSPIFPIPAGQTVITATATDPNNNTSEFSACFASPGGVTATPTFTVTPTPTLTPTGPAPTGTFTPTATATATATFGPGGPSVNVPTLSGPLLALLGLALAAVGWLVLRRI